MKSVNIIGRGIGWDKAPLEEYSWGITLTNLNRKVDLVIDMNIYHDGRWGQDELDKATKSRLLAAQDSIPYIDLLSYPLRSIIEHFHTDYFSNTVDYALALAIYQGFTSISLYGINMANDTEYSYQKPGVEFWIGQAMGRGIDIQIQRGYSTLLKTRDNMLYGYNKRQALT